MFSKTRLTQHDISILLVSFLFTWYLWQTWSTKWISDDGYIYLTYAQNAIDNKVGLVFNEGQWVEGFTSPLWMVFLLLLGLVRPLLQLDWEQTVTMFSLGLGIVSWFVFASIGPVLKRSREAPLLNPGLALFSVLPPLQSFSTSGLETPLVLLFVTILLKEIAIFQSTRQVRKLLPIVLACGVWVRPEFLLICPIIGSVVIAASRTNRRHSFWVIAGYISSSIGLLFGLRIIIFGNIFPNTYFAKSGVSFGIGQGLTYLYDGLVPYSLLPLLVVSLLLPIWHLFRELRGSISKPLLSKALARFDLITFIFITVSLLAALRYGGDFMHGRFLVGTYIGLCAMLTYYSYSIRTSNQGSRDYHVAIGASIVLAASVVISPNIQNIISPDGTAEVQGIADESDNYLAGNPNLHSFNSENGHKWARDGRALGALSKELETEIGFVAGGIGQRAFYGQQDSFGVYIYDMLGLTRPGVADLAPLPGNPRVGHAKRAPWYFYVSDPRVQLAGLPFEGYNEVASFVYQRRTFVLAQPEFADVLLSHGIVDSAWLESYIGWFESQAGLSKAADGMSEFDVFVLLSGANNWQSLKHIPEIVALDATDSLHQLMEPRLAPERICGVSISCVKIALDRIFQAPIEVPDSEYYALR